MAKKKAVESEPTPAVVTDASAALPELTPKDRRFLLRVSRFLLAIRERPVFARAAAHGYSVDEHNEGWRLYRLAMGENRPLDFLAPKEERKSDVSNDVLQALDTFENQWFPRVRAIIKRFAKGGADALEAAFFKDLEQQPLGPAVVGSVSTFVQRVDELKTSKLTGAKAVHDVLVRRGLTSAVLEEVRKLIARAKTPTRAAEPSSSNADEDQKRLAEQHEALAELRAWREDWRSTLTPVFDYNTLLSLGLIAAKGRKKSTDDDEPDDGEPTPAS